MSRNIILSVISFFIYLLYQVLILQNVVLFHTAFCFLYVAYLLVLPVESNPLTLMGIGFVMGLAVDMPFEKNIIDKIRALRVVMLGISNAMRSRHAWGS